MRMIPPLRTLALAAMLVATAACSLPPSLAREQTDSRSMGQKIEDASITARLKTVYLFNPHLNSFKIDVDTSGGEVTLDGVVPTGIQKDLAGEIAKNAGGVTEVHNRLQVTKDKVRDPDATERTFSQSVIDATTTASVKMALALASDVTAHDINVDTRWGTVMLKGAVASKAERTRAEQVARDTAGVKDVVNDLEVTS